MERHRHVDQPAASPAPVHRGRGDGPQLAMDGVGQLDLPGVARLTPALDPIHQSEQTDDRQQGRRGDRDRQERACHLDVLPFSRVSTGAATAPPARRGVVRGPLESSPPNPSPTSPFTWYDTGNATV